MSLSGMIGHESRAFKTRHFARWMRKTDLTNAVLCAAIDEMERGLVDADLGGHVLKKRVSLPNRGKSGSVRTLVATQKGSLWFFVYGFEKNERANISNKELEALQSLAEDLLKLTAKALDAQVVKGALEEICHDCQA